MSLSQQSYSQMSSFSCGASTISSPVPYRPDRGCVAAQYCDVAGPDCWRDAWEVQITPVLENGTEQSPEQPRQQHQELQQACCEPDPPASPRTLLKFLHERQAPQLLHWSLKLFYFLLRWVAENRWMLPETATMGQAMTPSRPVTATATATAAAFRSTRHWSSGGGTSSRMSAPHPPKPPKSSSSGAWLRHRRHVDVFQSD